MGTFYIKLIGLCLIAYCALKLRYTLIVHEHERKRYLKSGRGAFEILVTSIVILFTGFKIMPSVDSISHQFFSLIVMLSIVAGYALINKVSIQRNWY